MAGQIVGYARVSSTDQNLDRQLEALGDVDRLFSDKVSGKNRERPGLVECMAYVREADTLRVSSLDRLARSLTDLRALVDELVAKGVTVEFLKERLTFTPSKSDPLSTMLLSVLGAIAEFERALILERQADGIAIAKTKGVYKGRKPALDAEKIEWARQQISAGVPKSRVARELGVARQTLYSSLSSSSPE